MKPLHISTPVPNGTYEVTVTVTAHEELTLTILSQSRRFMVHNASMKKDEKRDFVFDVSVCDYHKREESYTVVGGVELDILCDGNFTAVSAVSPVSIPIVYIAGDSTVTDQPCDYPYNPKSSYCGWGQMLPRLFNTGVAIENHAQSGASTEDFKRINFTAFKDKIKEGDFLIVEFGHNDQKDPSLNAYGGYSDNLRYYVNFAREKGAVPILGSPINRIIFNNDGTLLNLLGEYRNAVKSVCDELNVPFLDMWTRTTELFEAAGPVRVREYFWSLGKDYDYTHTNDIGGDVVSRFAADEICKNGVEPLAGLIRRELTVVDIPERDINAVVSNTDELEHVKTIGLVNIPLAEMDKDITKI